MALQQVANWKKQTGRPEGDAPPKRRRIEFLSPRPRSEVVEVPGGSSKDEVTEVPTTRRAKVETSEVVANPARPSLAEELDLAYPPPSTEGVPSCLRDQIPSSLMLESQHRSAS